MSSAPWIRTRTIDGILRMRGQASKSEVAQKFGVSERTVTRVWARSEPDGHYHPWSIVTDPYARMMIRSAWRFENNPGLMEAEDWTCCEILRMIRIHGPDKVRDTLASCLGQPNLRGPHESRRSGKK